jgi:hypothetical protein
VEKLATLDFVLFCLVFDWLGFIFFEDFQLQRRTERKSKVQIKKKKTIAMCEL